MRIFAWLQGLRTERNHSITSANVNVPGTGVMSHAIRVLEKK
jgi:hypothetical protein